MTLSSDGTGASFGRQADRYTFSVKIDPALVSKVSALASLDLTDTERRAMAEQLSRVVEFFEALKDIPEELLEDSESSRVLSLRTDEAGGCLDPAVVESNAPEFAHGHFVVPRVVTRDGPS